jgi:hypothetical protein
MLDAATASILCASHSSHQRCKERNKKTEEKEKDEMVRGRDEEEAQKKKKILKMPSPRQLSHPSPSLSNPRRVVLPAIFIAGDPSLLPRASAASPQPELPPSSCRDHLTAAAMAPSPTLFQATEKKERKKKEKRNKEEQ